MTGIHQADFVGAWGVEQMKIAQDAGLPFFVHTTATMIHEGTCLGPYKDPSNYALDDPYWEQDLSGFGCTATNAQSCSITISSCSSDKHKHDFDTLTNPHVSSWNASESGQVPKVMKKNPYLTSYEEGRQDMGFRNRSSSAVDLDDMIGTLLAGIDTLGVANNTYVIFTSDNGFHLGEHVMLFGKEHPYDTDVSLPLYIRGPNIPANSTVVHPTNHIDITATVVELASATAAGPVLDGLSFANVLVANPPSPAAWGRTFSFTEHFSNANTWLEIRRPLEGDRKKFHYWCQGDTEVFDMDADPWEMNNLMGTTAGAAAVTLEMPLGVTLSGCSGQNCINPTGSVIPKIPLPCKTTVKAELKEGEFRWDP